MNIKTIEINNCSECPYVSHTGFMTTGGAKPCCNHPKTVNLKGDNCFKRVIPYKNIYNKFGHVGRFPKSIPNWCPL